MPKLRLLVLYVVHCHSLRGFSSRSELQSALDRWINGFNAVESAYGRIEDWDVSKVTDMSGLFYQRQFFNANVTAWNTSAVTSMSYMFHGASAFNQPIGAWDTSAVTDMSVMFYGACLVVPLPSTSPLGHGILRQSLT